MSRKQLGVRIGERASVESWYLLRRVISYDGQIADDPTDANEARQLHNYDGRYRLYHFRQALASSF